MKTIATTLVLPNAIPLVRTWFCHVPWVRRFPAITATLTWLALSSAAHAVTPAPDGGYPNRNTAEGDSALNIVTGLGHDNTAIGYNGLFNNRDGSSNTANGSNALRNNDGGNDNTATGFQALYYNNNAINNTATGSGALYRNTTSNDNTANGFQALYNNNGSANAATGSKALISNTSGSNNTANGTSALYGNTTGGGNTADGAFALANNTSGSDNTAAGYYALHDNAGAGNTANGSSALLHNVDGAYNSATGAFALYSNTAGSVNTASGISALYNNKTGVLNTAIGFAALRDNVKGRDNIAVGQAAGQTITGNDNIDIGNVGVAGESNKIRIGTSGTQDETFIAGIYGATLTNGLPVFVDANGKLATQSTALPTISPIGHLQTVPPRPSSERFKDHIKPMGKTSESILALQPVTFQYKPEVDRNGIPQFGLIAEQVEEVNPDLVERDKQGRLYTVRYDAVNVMLLNEFLKEHHKVEQQETAIANVKLTGEKQEVTIAELKSAIARQQAEIKTLTASLKKQTVEPRKVSVKLEENKPVPSLAGNNQ